MRFFGLIVLLLVGCADAAKIKYVSPAPGERIVVTAGYEARPKQPHVRGDEFVFSFVLSVILRIELFLITFICLYLGLLPC